MAAIPEDSGYYLEMLHELIARTVEQVAEDVNVRMVFRKRGEIVKPPLVVKPVIIMQKDKCVVVLDRYCFEKGIESRQIEAKIPALDEIVGLQAVQITIEGIRCTVAGNRKVKPVPLSLEGMIETIVQEVAPRALRGDDADDGIPACHGSLASRRCFPAMR